MKIILDQAQAVKDARDHAAALARRPDLESIDPGLLGHAMLIEAMKLLFDPGAERAEALADGLLVIATADQKQFIDNNGFSDGMLAVMLGGLKNDAAISCRMNLLATARPRRIV